MEMPQMTPERMALYRASAQQREQALCQQVDERFDSAWRVAREAAVLLKTEFGVEQVVAFGSLVDRSFFHVRSDVDLAVWGLAEKVYYRAVGRLQALDTAVSVDLIRFEEAPAALQAVITRDGVEL
jgi:predicted nucleotidyltransferase